MLISCETRRATSLLCQFGNFDAPLRCVCRITPQTRDANTDVGADRCVCPVHTDAIHRCITQTGRTVKPFHNGNRGVTRSGTCGNLPKPTTPKEVEPVPTLTPVRPLQGRSLVRRIPAGGASRATQRLAMVGQLRRPYASCTDVHKNDV